MQYFCQADIENQPYPNSLFRYRKFMELTLEEEWDSIKNKWEPTTQLTRLIIGGDCTLMRITQEYANQIQIQQS
jgi:hypothetical protein